MISYIRLLLEFGLYRIRFRQIAAEFLNAIYF